MPKDLPPPELLRKLLRYKPETGKLYWRERPRSMFSSENSFKVWNARFAHKEAFTSSIRKGHKSGGIFGTLYLAHRVIWCMHYMRPPSHQIDHINGDPQDNRICNLRDVPQGVNGKNQKARTNNQSGVTGVCWHKRENKWRADIRVNGRQKHLGYFAEFSDAVIARLRAELDYGYHENHGRVIT